MNIKDIWPAISPIGLNITETGCRSTAAGTDL
jgi:hypothetical protein